MQRGVSLAVAALLMAGLFLAPTAMASGFPQTTFTRSYEGSHTIAWGAPGEGGAYFGSVFCNQESDGPSTGACLRYVTPKGGFSGWDFDVTLTDTVFAQNTAFLVGFDLNGSGNVDCTGPNGGPDLCFFGRGTVSGTVPTNAANPVLWVFPVTVHQSDSMLCCPQSFATTGQIVIEFHPE
jgi:hypothetical protein